MIQLQHVCKTYQNNGQSVRAVSDVTLAIAAGEFVALRGPSGCGKSTLLSLVGGLDRPTSGTVCVAGVDLAGLSAAARADFRAGTIGFVFQMFHLLPYLNVLDNVLAAAAGPRRAEAVARAQNLLERFQLTPRLRHRPPQLSIGERQRVALARALLNQPKLILADEPTGNLDPDNAAAVLEALGQFRSEGGTVLMVTHEELAASRADRTVLMRSGQIEI